MKMDLHPQLPLHDEGDKNWVNDVHGDKENGLVQVVELDEGGQGQDCDNPQVYQVLGSVFTIFIWNLKFYKHFKNYHSLMTSHMREGSAVHL